MERRQLPPIREYLQSRDVQERIQHKIAEARSKATVTISRATELFDFSENKLRDWEKRGLLGDERASRQDGRSASGHRQYTPADLDKLAVIRELLDQGYAVGELEREREEIWQAASIPQPKTERGKNEQLPIDRRIEQMDQGEFWRYFVSQALRLSITLIAEGIADPTIVGLVLPMHKDIRSEPLPAPENLSTVGESLIGWLEPNQSLHVFIDHAPHFEYASDFRIQRLVAMEANIPEEELPQDSSFIVLQRRAKPLTLTPLVIGTIRRLLEPIYKHIDEWKPCFDHGMRDWVYLSTNFTGNPVPTDAVLNKLTNMVIELGGKTEHGQDRWNFCCILLPQNPSLPLQQQSLIVRAQSKRAPHTIATTIVTPEDKNPGLSLKAFQSGHMIYLPDVSPENSMIAYQTKEGPVCSAIAIPISGHDGLSVAVMYIASNEAQAFSENDQRLLRMICRMAEELFATYNARQQFPGKLTEVLAHPEIVDTSFEDFLSEGDFVRDIESLLSRIKEGITSWKKTVRREDVSLAERKVRYEEERLSDKVVSFIGIDVDNHSSLTNKYGDYVARDLSNDIGQRIYKQLTSIVKNSEDYHLYHVSTDRFYLILHGMSLDEVRTKAEHLRKILEGTYYANLHHASVTQPNSPQYTVELPGITARIAVTWFSFSKLEEILQRSELSTALPDVRNLIIHSLDQVLLEGQRKGGNIVISWDPIEWGYVLYPPIETS